MKKIGIALILCIVIMFSFNMPKSHLYVKAYESNSTQSGPYKLFLPLVVKQESHQYFVSPNGNDSNPGTFLQPWKTIGQAARMVVAGDIIFIRGGVYNESVYFRTSGTVLSPIRIMAYPGENPIMDGYHTIPEYGGSLLRIVGDYIYASGIEVRNSAYEGIRIQGNYDVVANMYVHHSYANGITITEGHNSTAEYNRIWRNSMVNEYGVHNWGAGISAIRGGVSYATIRHNTVWENWGEGISSSTGDHTIIEDNIVHDNFSANIYIESSTNVLVQRNFVYTNPSSYVYPYGSHVGIMMGDESSSSSNITIINNISYGNKMNFTWWKGVESGVRSNVLIANNTFVNSRYHTNIDIGSINFLNARFENNIVKQDDGLYVILIKPDSQVTYNHNLWSKPPLAAASGSGDLIGDPKLAKIGDPYAPDWFRVTELSPAIDKALLIPEILDDYFHFFRGSNPDMGAIEYLP